MVTDIYLLFLQLVDALAILWYRPLFQTRAVVYFWPAVFVLWSISQTLQLNMYKNLTTNTNLQLCGVNTRSHDMVANSNMVVTTENLTILKPEM